MPDKLCIVGHLAAKQKKHKRITDRTFLISESKGQYRVFLLLATGGAVLAYLRTICPTVVPGDSGELITACFTLGIAHWPGYPLYVILGNIALNIFTTAEPAYVMNLMSVAFGVLTVGLLYAIIYHFIRIPFLAASVSLLFGFGQTFWSQTVIAEVYTLHAVVGTTHPLGTIRDTVLHRPCMHQPPTVVAAFADFHLYAFHIRTQTGLREIRQPGFSHSQPFPSHHRDFSPGMGEICSIGDSCRGCHYHGSAEGQGMEVLADGVWVFYRRFIIVFVSANQGVAEPGAELGQSR
jgi:hypothetical protein